MLTSASVYRNIAETDALVSANSVLAEKDQMQPEEQLPQVPRDATHKSALVSGTSPALKNLKRMAEIRCYGGERNSSSDEDKSLSDEEYVPESDSESDSSLDLAIGYENKAKVSEQKLKAVHSKFTKSCSSKLPLKHASKGNGKQCLKAREGTCLNEEADLFCYEEQLTDVESDVESDSSREWEDAPLREVQVKPVSDIKLSLEFAALGSRRNYFCLTRSVTVTPRKEELLEVRGSANEADFQDVPLTGQEDTMAAAENCLQSSVISCSENKKNYCYICGKPQSKFSRHLKTHMNDIEVSEALSFPK
ncbi:hypothetical protein MHYP_G00147540 [Metynnis hypsauchen]